MTLALDSHTSTISAAESHGSLASLARRYQAALRSIHAGTASLLADGERAVDVERRLRDVLAHRDEGAGEEQDEQEMRRVALAASLLLQVMTSTPSDYRSAMSILSAAVASSPSSSQLVSPESGTLTMTHVLVGLVSLRSRISSSSPFSDRACERICALLEASSAPATEALQMLFRSLNGAEGGPKLHGQARANVLGKRPRSDGEGEDDSGSSLPPPLTRQLGLQCAVVLGIKGLRQHGEDADSAGTADVALLQQRLRSAFSETCGHLLNFLASQGKEISTLAAALERASRTHLSGQAAAATGKPAGDILAWLPPLRSLPSAETQARCERAQITVLVNRLSALHLDWASKIQFALPHLRAFTASSSRSPDFARETFYERLFDAGFEALESCDGHEARAQQLRLWETTLFGVVPHIIYELTSHARDGFSHSDQSLSSSLKRSCSRYLDRTPSVSAPASAETGKGRSDRPAREEAVAAFILAFADLHLISQDQALSLLPPAHLFELKPEADKPTRLMHELIAQSTERGASIETVIAQEYLNDSPRTASILQAISEQPRAALVAKFCGSAIIDTLRRATAADTTALDSLALVCSALTDQPGSLRVITAFHPAVRLVEPLLAVFESDEVLNNLCGPGAGADDEPAMLSRVLLSTHWLVKLAPGTEVARTAGSASQPSPIARRHLFFATSSEAFHLAQLDQEAENPLISRWISELFDSDGIGDELIRDSPPRLLIKLAATLFDQAVAAAELGVIDVEMLRSGLSFFLQDLLSYTLPGVLTWIIQDIRRVEPWEGRTVAAHGNGEGAAPTASASQAGSSSSKTSNSRSTTEAPTPSRGALLLSVLSMLVLDESCPALAIELASDPFRLLLRDGVLSNLLSPSTHTEGQGATESGSAAAAGGDANAGKRVALPGVDAATVEAMKSRFEAIEKRRFGLPRPGAWLPVAQLTSPSEGKRDLPGGNGSSSTSMTPQAASSHNREGVEGAVDQMSRLEDLALLYSLLACLHNNAPTATTSPSPSRSSASGSGLGVGVGVGPDAEARVSLRRCLRPLVKRLAELKQSQSQRQTPRRSRLDGGEDDELETWIGLTTSVLAAHLMQSARPASDSHSGLDAEAGGQGSGMDVDTVGHNTQHGGAENCSDLDPAHFLSELVYLLDLTVDSDSAANADARIDDSEMLLLRTRTLLAARVLALFAHLPRYDVGERIRQSEGESAPGVGSGQAPNSGANVGLGLGLGLGTGTAEDLVMATRPSAEEDDLFGTEDGQEPEPEPAGATEAFKGNTNAGAEAQAGQPAAAHDRRLANGSVRRERGRVLLARLRSRRLSGQEVQLPDLIQALIVHVLRVCTALHRAQTSAAPGVPASNLRSRLQILSAEIVGAFPATSLLPAPEGAATGDERAEGAEQGGEVSLRGVAEAVLEEVWGIMLGVTRTESKA